MGTISMSRKERKRLEAFSRVKSGGMTLVEASELLGLSYRQTKRAWSRYQSEGDAGLVHRLRGRAPNRHSPEEMKQQSLALYREQYADYGPTLAAECLEKEDGVKVSVTTLRRWLLQAGLLDRRRKRRLHRRRRTRREHLGELVQMDGSSSRLVRGATRLGGADGHDRRCHGNGDGAVLRERIVGIVVGLVSALCPAARLAARSVRGSAQYLSAGRRADGRGFAR